MKPQVLLSTDFKDFKLYKRGKVRDVYDLGGRLLIISTDRISCFDVVLPDCIPDKGKVLTQISLFWFEFIKEIIPSHLITADIDEFPEQLKKYKDILQGRAMLVKKAQALPIECIVRGYLSGSGWKEYKNTNSISGISLPEGLKESAKLPEPIFTPSTKAEVGHDINVDYEYTKKLMGDKTAQKLKNISIKIYKKASEYAEQKGIIIADTKFEFGLYNNEVIIIDEVLTPDSSRFWPRDIYKPGGPQQSFDKQFVRDYLETLDWEKKPPAPKLPLEIIQKTCEKYLEIFKKLTDRKI